MQVTVDDMSDGDVQELAEVARRPYALCLQTVSMYTDVDIAALIASSMDNSLRRYHGGATMWHDLARQCVPRPLLFSAWPGRSAHALNVYNSSPKFTMCMLCSYVTSAERCFRQAGVSVCCENTKVLGLCQCEVRAESCQSRHEGVWLRAGCS